MSDKPSKTLYHSSLSELGAVQVTIKSDPLKSRYKGKPNYVIMLIDGHERIYNCENQQCEQVLVGRKGQKLMIEATGSREDAAIKILGKGANPSAPAAAAAAPREAAPEDEYAERDYPSGDEPPRKTSPAQPQKPAQTNGGAADALTLARQRAARHANAMLIGLDGAYYIAGKFFQKTGIEFSPEDLRSIAISMVIDLERCGLLEKLPISPIELKAQAPKQP